MTERTQKIIDLIYKSAKKAADPGLTGTDVQKLQGDTQKMIKKTFKEFVESVEPVVSKWDAKVFNDKWAPNPNRKPTLGPGENYGSENYQKQIEAAKNREREKIEANNRRAREDSSSTGQGIYGWYLDPKTPDSKITKRGWKKNGKITWIT